MRAKTQRKKKTECAYLVLQRICARLPKMTLLFSNCLLFLMLVSRVVFCVSVSSALVWRIIQVLCFFKLPLLSPGLFLFFVVLRPVLVRERFLLVRGSKNLRIRLVTWCFGFVRPFPLSLLFSSSPVPRCCSVYIGLGGLITGGRLRVDHH